MAWAPGPNYILEIEIKKFDDKKLKIRRQFFVFNSIFTVFSPFCQSVLWIPRKMKISMPLQLGLKIRNGVHTGSESSVPDLV
jgi:hypothetical protein